MTRTLVISFSYGARICLLRKKNKKESLRASKTAQQVKVLFIEPDLPEFHT